MSELLLDTHAWIWWMDHDRRLSTAELAALDSLPTTERPLLCDISLWEAAMLVERGRLSFSVDFRDWLAAAAHPRTVRVIPITPEVAAEVTALPPAFHRDHADRIIVATCRVLNVPLLTRDQSITHSRLVKRWRPSSGTRSRPLTQPRDASVRIKREFI
jgi:PIN domain nuclease of toxin-antitoxin system